MDDNNEIIDLLKSHIQNNGMIDILNQRLELGRERYGHGVRVMDDTTEWGTKENSWVEMAHEEIYDGLIYFAAQIIRFRKLDLGVEREVRLTKAIDGLVKVAELFIV